VAAPGEQVGQRRDVAGKVSAVEVGDRSLAPTDPHDAVVIEHRDAVAGQPDVALEPGGAEAKAQLEGLQGVLRSMGASTAMSEPDGPFEERREPLLHDSR
jgi:hypothetical protein